MYQLYYFVNVTNSWHFTSLTFDKAVDGQKLITRIKHGKTRYNAALKYVIVPSKM